MKQKRMRNDEPYLRELSAQGIRYEPAVISCFGRRHPDTTKMMMLAARRAARYRGMSSHQGLLNRWFRTIAAQVWLRAARMIKACLPDESSEAEFLLEGVRPEGTDPFEAET
eukprot:937584-Karenia_brevis.AAC.1